MAEGIRVRHSRPCRKELADGLPPRREVEGEPCRCKPGPSYEASVYSPLDGKKIRRSFSGHGASTEAKRWRRDALADVQKGRMRAPTPITVREAATEWLKLARAGVIRTRSEDPYKPSALRGYEADLRLRLLDRLGPTRLSELTRPKLQLLVAEWQTAGLAPSTIRNSLLPLRAIYRDLELLGIAAVPVNPTTGLRLPKVEGERNRIASPEEAARLIAAAPGQDRPIWATAMYGGLRRGELAALRWEHVDLAQGVIRVERSYDYTARAFIAPKSRKARRRVPIPAVLRDVLVEHRMDYEAAGRAAPEVLVFGRDAEVPFGASGVRRRALAAWKRAGLDPIGLHECRHTFASLMIAAGANAKALSTYLGHASIQLTFDRYGHLMPGNEAEAAALLDRFLERAREEAARAAVQ
jgi:integrase